MFAVSAEKIWPHAATGACCKGLSRPQYETWHCCHGYDRACVVLLLFFAKSTRCITQRFSILESRIQVLLANPKQLVLQFFPYIVFSPLPWTWLRSQFCKSLLSASLHISALILLFRGRSSQPFLRWCPCVQLNVKHRGWYWIHDAVAHFEVSWLVYHVYECIWVSTTLWNSVYNMLMYIMYIWCTYTVHIMHILFTHMMY